MVSIITITFNNYEGLIKTVESIRGVEDIEHVVVNGGSCEKTRRFLESYQGRSVSERDKGISDAFNKGLSLSTGDSILFLNSGDTLLDLKYLNEVNKILDHEPEIYFVYADFIFVDGLCGDLRLTPVESSLGRGMPYPHPTIVVRRKIFEDVGIFRLNYSIVMDYEWMCRIYKAGYRGYYWEKRPVVRMDGRGISTTREYMVLWESFQALRQNNLLNLKNIYGFSVRIGFYIVRKGMERGGMAGLLKYLKRKKYAAKRHRKHKKNINTQYLFKLE